MGLWEVLETAGERNVANVKELVEYAAGKLILVRETFPDYTMHDERHAKNVIALMEELLGGGIGDLTPLEAGMLILAAYFHDIGMVYGPDEVAELITDQDFADFLSADPAAYVRVHQAGGVPPTEVIVQYCRSRHAERVAEHLFRLGSGLLSWDDIPITQGLADLCESHNQGVGELRTDRFPTAFLGSCDLRMCAILLRLADILDLGTNRSPAAVYDHLRLSATTGVPRSVSNTEWTKHLAFRGFKFPVQRTPSYALFAFASPRKPAVENAIRKFLDVVEEELRSCRILLDFCDRRWRSLPLPGSVDRSGIVSDGYRYGEYRFVLDRHEVLRLFMGEQLYANRYAFIRELLQNSVDACRLNTYLHDADPASMEVRVSAWEDESGHFWFRVDDTGTGMDQEIVEKYFLGVGKSYYRSDDLQADILRKNKPQQQFVAISRFGIGVLSSFLVGDRIEVSTRRVLANGKMAAPLRLSLDSIDDFFVMRERPMATSPMPGRKPEASGYRKDAGTSIAVRIDPAKADVSIQTLLENAEKAFFFPPVRVYINDAEQAQCAASQLEKPIAAGPIRYPILSRPTEIAPLDLSPLIQLSVIAVPLDLTTHSPSAALRGQLMAITAEAEVSPSLLPAFPAQFCTEMPDDLKRILHNCVSYDSLSLSKESYYWDSDENDDFEIKVHVDIDKRALEDFQSWLRSVRPDVESRDFNDSYHARIFASTQRMLDGRTGVMPTDDNHIGARSTYRVKYDEFIERGKLVPRSSWNWLGHNGISVSTRMESTRLSSTEYAELIPRGRAIVIGTVSLLDQLRPDVSISRDTLRTLSCHIHSALQLAARRAANAHRETSEGKFAEDFMKENLITSLEFDDQTIGDFQDDPLAREWGVERIIPARTNADARPTESDLYSVSELRSLAERSPVKLWLPHRLWSAEDDFSFLQREFYDILQLSVAQLELDVEISEPKGWGAYFDVTVCSANRPVSPAGLPVLFPFTVAPYDSPDILIAPQCPANLRHPVVEWFAERARTLSDDYPAFFAQIRRALAAVANLNYEPGERKQQVADDAARQLNTILDRLRRSGSSVPVPSFREITADSSGRLVLGAAVCGSPAGGLTGAGCFGASLDSSRVRSSIIGSGNCSSPTP